jgi:hypothetical protein
VPAVLPGTHLEQQHFDTGGCCAVKVKRGRVGQVTGLRCVWWGPRVAGFRVLLVCAYLLFCSGRLHKTAATAAVWHICMCLKQLV